MTGTEPKTGPGRVERAVAREIRPYRKARPGLYEAVITLAQVMDNPRALDQHSIAATRMAAIIAEMRSGTQASTGSLASVKAMARKAG